MLPLFRAPASASFSTEPFRLVTAFLRQGDLLEGRDNMCTQMQAGSAGSAERQSRKWLRGRCARAHRM